MTNKQPMEIFNRLVALGLEPYNLQKPVYKYRTKESAINILKSNELYFPNAVELSKYDKLEVHSSILDLSFTPELKNRYLTRMFTRGNVTDIDINSVSDMEFRSLLSHGVDRLRENVGIFSTGKSPNNGYLWERYGEVHKGVCFGLIIPENTIVSKLCFNITYTNQPHKIKFLDPVDADLTNDIFYWYCVKKPFYSNEEEVRLINELAAGSIIFNKEMLFEVIMGADTTDDDYRLICETLEQNGYSPRIGKIVEDSSKFDLQISYFN